MDPELEALLALLGVETPLAARSAIVATNAALSDMRSATGQHDMSAVRNVVQGVFAEVRKLEAVTGKQGVEAVSAAMAWRDGASDSAAARAALTELLDEATLGSLGDNPPMAKLVGALQAQRKAQTEAKAKALLDDAVAEGHLRPANRGEFEKVFATYGLGAMQAALAAIGDDNRAPSGKPPRQPTGNVNDSALTDEEREVAKQLGIPEAQAIANKKAHQANT